MELNGNTLANIHLLKTHLSKMFNIEFNKIKFVKLNNILERKLIDKFDSKDDLEYVEDLFSVDMDSVNGIKNCTLLDDYYSTIIDRNTTYEGETIGQYIVKKDFIVNNSTMLMIIKHSNMSVKNVEIIVTESFRTFLKKEITNMQLVLLSYDRNIANLNHLYFGSIKDAPTLN